MTMQPDDCKRAFFLATESQRSRDDDQWLQDHLARCSQCRQDFRRMATLADLVRKEPVPESSPEEVAQYVAQLARMSPRPMRATRAATKWRRRAVAAAAVLFLLGSAIGLWRLLGQDSRHGTMGTDRPWSGMAGEPVSSRLLRQARRNDLGMQDCPFEPLDVQGTWKTLSCGPSGTCPPQAGTVDGTRLADATWKLTTGSGPVRMASAQGKVLFVAGPRTLLQRVRSPGWRMRLVRGDLYVAVNHDSGLGRCLVIGTSAGRIRIEGTRFLITQRPQTLTVHTYEGTVRLTRAKAGDLLVSKGQRLTLDSTGKTSTGPVQGAAHNVLAGPPSWVQQASKPGSAQTHGLSKTQQALSSCSMKHLRSLGRRFPGRATKEIERCLTARRLGPEGLMLQAELALVLHQAGKAARIYHRVARRHRGSPIGQDALFAAGQVELSRMGNQSRALRTFHMYLKWYPAGRYAKDVHRVIASIQQSKTR